MTTEDERVLLLFYFTYGKVCIKKNVFHDELDDSELLVEREEGKATIRMLRFTF